MSLRNIIMSLFITCIIYEVRSQSIAVNNDQYHLYGPNSTWNEYLQIGGNGRVTSHASVAATNGNLHLDSKAGAFALYLNFYNQGNTLINSQGGLVGIGTTNPESKLHVVGTTTTDLLTLSEGATHLGYFGRGGSITGGWSQTPNILAINYHTRDFAIGGWSKSGATWMGAAFYINSDNNFVGIGTTVPDAKLTVKGKIHAEEVKVDLNVPGPDYVFEEDYDLKSLEEVEKFVSDNKHLPEIPSAKTMKEEGISMGEMQMKLLQKIEELTLYSIEQNKKLAAQNKRVELLEKAIEDLRK